MPVTDVNRKSFSVLTLVHYKFDFARRHRHRSNLYRRTISDRFVENVFAVHWDRFVKLPCNVEELFLELQRCWELAFPLKEILMEIFLICNGKPNCFFNFRWIFVRSFFVVVNALKEKNSENRRFKLISLFSSSLKVRYETFSMNWLLAKFKKSLRQFSTRVCVD